MFIYLYWWYSYISVIKIPFGGFRFTSILVSSIVLFAVLAKIASRKELGYYIELGNILFEGIIGILIASIINIFIGEAMLSLLISIVGIVIFSAYALYDISLIKSEIQNDEMI